MYSDATVARAKAALRLGISAKVISRITGVHRMTVYAWGSEQIRPNVQPDPDFAKQLAALLNGPVA